MVSWFWGSCSTEARRVFFSRLSTPARSVLFDQLGRISYEALSPVMFLAAQTFYNNCNFSSHSPQHKRLFHGNSYKKAAKAYQIEKCNSFHWSHFRGKGIGIWLGSGGVGVEGLRGGSGWKSCHSVCCSSVCFSTSVYGAFKSLQMCRGLRPTSPPQKPWASCQRRLTVKINSTDTASESYTGGCRRKKVADSRLGLWNNYFLHYVVFLSDW